MRILKYISIVMVLIIGVTQCKLPDNVDPKNPTEVPIETLFTNGEIALLNQVDHVSVNLNTTRLLVQYWQQTTYFDESRYLFLDRQIPDNYTEEFYRDALMDLKRTKELLAEWPGNEGEKSNKIAMTTILEVYGWHCVVDAFGDMPYTEALMLSENSTPVYDDAATIYTSIISELGIAISMLDINSAGFGGADVLFGGDIAAWKRFGASLQMRLGMRLADVNATTAKATFEAGVANGAFTDQDQSAILNYVGVVPNVNAIYDAFTVDGRNDYLPTNTIIDIMSNLEDPRLKTYFSPVSFNYEVNDANEKIDTELPLQIVGTPQKAILLYKGGDSLVQVDLPFTALQIDTLNPFKYHIGAIAGLDGVQTYVNFSNFAAPFFESTFPAIIQDYVEIEFLLAEAAERAFAVSGSAEDHYNNAIQASILYWGGTQDEVDIYLARADVAYTTAAGTWKEKIGTQKWIALYNRGIEGWAEWRRLDAPTLNNPEGMSANDLPMRYPYPYNEKLQNEDNYNAAVAKMGGTDDRRQKIFWDKN
jgi:hypothetical protein